MDYDLFITRAETPTESRLHPIPEAEWKALLQSDTSLEISQSDFYDRRAPDGQTERVQKVLWKEHPDRPPFMLIDGAVQSNSPDDATIQKMVEMAGNLRARVIGEQGETYRLNRVFPKSTARAKVMSWPLWKKLLAVVLFASVLLSLKLLVFGG